MRTDLKQTLARLQGVTKRFRTPVSDVLAVDDVTVTLAAGGALGIIGESGSGKSTLGRIAVGLLTPDEGEVEVVGMDVAQLDRDSRQKLRTSVSIVFQEPFASLDPRRTVLQSVIEPLEVKYPGRRAAAHRRTQALSALERVGLSPEYAHRYPGMLSGGQQQRVGIARAVVTKPAVVLLDEPTSALDRSIRGDILTLLRGLREQEGLTFLVITHDVETVEALADDIIVMYRGRVVEQGRARELLNSPQHPYTRSLLAARLSVDPLEPLPPLADVPSGQAEGTSECDFYTRCPLASDACTDRPIRLMGDGTHLVRCVLAKQSNPSEPLGPTAIRPESDRQE